MDEFRQSYTQVKGPLVSKELLETVYRGLTVEEQSQTSVVILAGGFVGGNRVVPGGGGIPQ